MIGDQVANITDVLLRNDEDVDGRSRRDVAEGIHVLAVENRGARDLSGDDLAE
jgi:hypothetical protein